MNSKVYFIYKYTFPNGKVYIGQTYKGSGRFGKASNYSGTLVYRAMKKYQTFKKEIIEYCDEDDVDIRERFWIEYYKSSHRDYGYNRDSGGNLNKHLSDDLKKQLSANHKGLFAKPVLQYDLHGTFITEWKSQREVLDVLGISVNGCCVGRQTTSGGYQWKSKDDDRIIEDIYNPIQQFSLDGKFIKEWQTINEAAEQLGINKSGIINCCNHKNKSAGGYQWKRKQDSKEIGVYKKEQSSTVFQKGQVAHNKGCGKKVSQYTVDGLFVKEWNCIADAQRELNISNISVACRNPQRLAGNYQWKYSSDDRKIQPFKREKRMVSAETKAKLSQSKKGKPSKRKGAPGLKGAKNPRATPIIQYSMNDEFIKEWDYIGQAAEQCGVAPSTITGALKGYQKSAGGFKWKYK